MRKRALTLAALGAGLLAVSAWYVAAAKGHGERTEPSETAGALAAGAGLPEIPEAPPGPFSGARGDARGPGRDEDRGKVRAGGTLEGRVTNLFGEPIEGAWVEISYGRRESDESGLPRWGFVPWEGGRRTTDAGGSYRLEVPRGGYALVEAGAAGMRTASAQRQLPVGGFQARIDFRLAREDRMTVRGRLLDPRGAPLSPEEVRFLFPDDFPAADDAKEVGFSGICALTEPFRRPAQAPRGRRAAIEAERATFEIQTTQGWEPQVIALSRGRRIGERSWRDGDPEVEFRVDAGAFRASLGTLEVRVLDAGSGVPLPATVRVEGHPLGAGGYQFPSLAVDPEEGLRFVRVPPGTYDVVASAAGYEAAARTEVLAGKAARATLRFAQSAEVVLRLLDEDGWLVPSYAPNVQYRDLEGRLLACASSVEPGSNGALVRVRGAPPGPGALLLSRNVLPVDLAPGSNGEIEFPIRRPRLVTVKWPKDDARRFSDVGEASLLVARGTRVDHRPWGALFHFDEEWDAVQFFVPPGRYVVEVELGCGRRGRSAVVVGPAPATDAFLEPR